MSWVRVLVAGFQVTISGRFWVITEVDGYRMDFELVLVPQVRDWRMWADRGVEFFSTRYARKPGNGLSGVLSRLAAFRKALAKAEQQMSRKALNAELDWLETLLGRPLQSQDHLLKIGRSSLAPDCWRSAKRSP